MQDKNIRSEDYISYSGVKGVIAQLLRFFIRIIDFLFAILFRNKFLILGGLLMGMILGYLYHSTNQRSYKISMIVEFTELNKKAFAEILGQLNMLVKTNSTKELAQELHINEPMAKNIGFIDSRNMYDEPLSKDTSTKTGQTFKIIVDVNDNLIADTLQSVFENYLNKNPYLHRLKESQKIIHEQKLAFIDSELAKLDSLKLEYNKFLASSKVSSTIYNNAFNPAEIYVQSNNLANQKEVILRWLQLNSTAVSVVDGFKSTANPQSASLLKVLILFGISGAFLGFLLGLFREMKRRLVV